MIITATCRCAANAYKINIFVTFHLSVNCELQSFPSSRYCLIVANDRPIAFVELVI